MLLYSQAQNVQLMSWQVYIVCLQHSATLSILCLCLFSYALAARRDRPCLKKSQYTKHIDSFFMQKWCMFGTDTWCKRKLKDQSPLAACAALRPLVHLCMGPWAQTIVCRTEIQLQSAVCCLLSFFWCSQILPTTDREFLVFLLLLSFIFFFSLLSLFLSIFHHS